MSVNDYKKEIPLIDVNYTIVIYDNPNELIERFKDIKLEPSPESFGGAVFEWEDRFYIVLEDNDKLTNGIIAHESNHLLNLAFIWINQDLDRYNDELQCRFLQNIVDSVHECLNERRKTIK